jgi:hypothetical protein
LKLIAITNCGIEFSTGVARLTRDSEQSCLTAISVWQTSGNGSKILVAGGNAAKRSDHIFVGTLVSQFIYEHNPNLPLRVGSVSAGNRDEDMKEIADLICYEHKKMRPRVSSVTLVSASFDSGRNLRLLKKWMKHCGVDDLCVELETFESSKGFFSKFISRFK